MENREKIREALDRIKAGLESIDTDEGWLEFLRFQSSFYNYSFRNTMLIFAQRPGATYVRGYRAWNEMGRHVRRGSRGIKILCPCIYRKKTGDVKPDTADGIETDETSVLTGFRIGNVFDISDTEGDDASLPVLVRGMSGGGYEEARLYEKIKTHVEKEYPVREESAQSAVKGTYHIERKEITVQSNLELKQKIKTLLHEYSHAVDYKLHPDEDIPRCRRELVAESSAFVVSSWLGIDTAEYSIPYIKTWQSDGTDMLNTADSIQKVAGSIIKGLDECVDLRKEEDRER